MGKNIITYEIELEPAVKKILHILNLHGEGYIVGGYIRDKLLNLSPEDCDFVTNISYTELLNIFKDYSPKEIGKQFGIIQIKYENHFYEIAKYRVDLGKPVKRNEQIVSFTQDIFEDLKRRDFTVNSIAYDGSKIIFWDFALSDLLEKKSLIFNGDLSVRVSEDPLRLLRGIRFSLTKNLHLEDSEIYKEYIHLLSQLSTERIRDEFVKIILGKNPSEGIERLISIGAMRFMIPEIIDYDSQFFKILDDSENNIETRLAILLKKLPHREILFRLKFSKKIVLKVENLKTPFSKKNLLLTGSDLQNLGIFGKKIGETLDLLLDLVLKNKLENNHETLLSFVKNSRTPQ
ncbi:MAG: hypothetical protein ACRCZ2_02290 [Fusobacteriaceae bacterium]